MVGLTTVIGTRSARRTPSVLAVGASIRLIPINSTGSRPATFAQLVRLTALQTRDKTFGWFGGAYGVTVNASGQISSLTELFHP